MNKMSLSLKFNSNRNQNKMRIKMNPSTQLMLEKRVERCKVPSLSWSAKITLLLTILKTSTFRMNRTKT